MKIARLVLSKSSENENVRELVTEIEELKTRGGRVYCTRLYHGSYASPHHIFTTSKEIHLKLGLMSEKGQSHLFGVILVACDEESAGVIVSFEGEEKAPSLFATRVEGEALAFHLEPIH